MVERKKMGFVVFDEGRYFLKVDDRREELPVETVLQGEELEKLVGQEVEVLLSEPRQAVVGLIAKDALRFPIFCYVPPWPPWPPCFMCYLPAPWLIKGVEREVQVNLAKRFLEEGYISEEVFRRLV